MEQENVVPAKALVKVGLTFRGQENVVYVMATNYVQLVMEKAIIGRVDSFFGIIN